MSHQLVTAEEARRLRFYWVDRYIQEAARDGEVETEILLDKYTQHWRIARVIDRQVVPSPDEIQRMYNDLGYHVRKLNDCRITISWASPPEKK